MKPLTANQKLSFGFVAFCVLSVVASWPRRGPEWNGRTLKEWLRVSHDAHQIFVTGRDTGIALEPILKQRAEADEAIYQMGPTIVPRLMAFGEEEDSALRANLERFSKSVGWKSHPFEREPSLKQAALYALAVFGSKAAPALPALSNALFQPEPDHAVLAPLVGIGEPALPVLLSALTNSQPRVRGMAYSGLSAMATNAGSLAPKLRGLLAHPDLETRGRAIALLAGVTPLEENPFPALLALRTNPAPEIRLWVVTGLSMAARVRNADAPGMVEAANAVAEFTRDSDTETRRRAAWGLQHFKSAAAPHIPILVERLREQSDSARYAAVGVLVSLKLRLPETIPALVEMLSDPKPFIQEEAAAGLREMATETETIRPGLISSLGDLGKARFDQKRLYREDYERREARRLERLKAKPEAKK